VKQIATFLSASALLLAFSAHAQTAGAAASTPAGTNAQVVGAQQDMAEAEVRRIDKDAKKVTLKHGPIKHLDMPGMTMVFQVRDASLFDKMAAGDKIRFTAEQMQGAYVVTGVEKVEAK
jgi:Cu(I)/Ag(I) efflux system periplasmic protein CusF